VVRRAGQALRLHLRSEGPSSNWSGWSFQWSRVGGKKGQKEQALPGERAIASSVHSIVSNDSRLLGICSCDERRARNARKERRGLGTSRARLATVASSKVVMMHGSGTQAGLLPSTHWVQRCPCRCRGRMRAYESAQLFGSTQVDLE
jgi:hypothetical protein